MAETAKKRTKSKVATTPALATWGKRALIAIVAGVSIGAGAGVFTVHRLEPGRGTGVDSLAAMLDSIAKGRIREPGAAQRAAESQRRDDSARAATPEEMPAERIAVPSLVDLDEGAARNALLDAGLQVGEVQFEASPKPAGTVLATIPAAGQMLPLQGAVTIVLSDGRTAPTDTLLRLLPQSAP
ncbi:MAG: PASTA domain-containing protein [Gemmatimonas sp.]